MPHWIGGLPSDAPPRPGTPAYEAWQAERAQEAARPKGKDAKQMGGGAHFSGITFSLWRLEPTALLSPDRPAQEALACAGNPDGAFFTALAL
jgi:hypothetical protein